MMEFMEYAKMECNLQFGWLSHATAVCVFIFIRFDIHTNWHLWKQNCNRIISPVAFSQTTSHTMPGLRTSAHTRHTRCRLCALFSGKRSRPVEGLSSNPYSCNVVFNRIAFFRVFFVDFPRFFFWNFCFFKIKFSAWLDLIGNFRVWCVGGEGLLRVLVWTSIPPLLNTRSIGRPTPPPPSFSPLNILITLLTRFLTTFSKTIPISISKLFRKRGRMKEDLCFSESNEFCGDSKKIPEKKSRILFALISCVLRFVVAFHQTTKLAIKLRISISDGLCADTTKTENNFDAIRQTAQKHPKRPMREPFGIFTASIKCLTVDTNLLAS